jgi:hypothetical protein
MAMSGMVLGAVLVLAIILAPIIVLWAIGRFASRWLTRNAPQSQYIRPVKPTLMLIALFTVLFFGSALIIRAFEPATTIGQFLNSRYGLLVLFGLPWLFSAAASLVRWIQKNRGGV